MNVHRSGAILVQIHRTEDPQKVTIQVTCINVSGYAKADIARILREAADDYENASDQ